MQTGLSFNQTKVFFLIVYVSGYFGARCLSIVVEQPQLHLFPDFLVGLFQIGPMTFYGGFLCAGLLGTLYLCTLKMNVLKVLDIVIVGCFLALGIGRIGCFLNGDDFGKVISAGQPFWGVSFPVLKDGEFGIIRYPVQIMETIFVWGFVGWFLLKRPLFQPGRVFFFGLVYYGVGRVFLEMYRGDNRGWVLASSISTSQFISFFVTLGGIIGFLWLLQTREQRR